MTGRRPMGAEVVWSADRGGAVGHRSGAGLLIPADTGRRLTVVVLRLTAVDLSDAIGGGLLEDALCGEYDGAGYTLYMDEHRATKGLPANERAAVLAARMGHVNRRWLADLRGDVLILGCDEHLDDVSVPPAVVDAARQSGLMGAGGSSDGRG